MAGHLVLVQVIGVRIPASEPKNKHESGCFLMGFERVREKQACSVKRS